MLNKHMALASMKIDMDINVLKSGRMVSLFAKRGQEINGLQDCDYLVKVGLKIIRKIGNLIRYF